MAFNIYEWRRNQLLTENSIYNNPNDLYTGNLDAGKKEDDKKMLQQLLNWYKSQDDADPAMIDKLEMQIGGIKENSDNAEFKYGTYSKDKVIAKVGPGGQVRWGSKLVTVDELPDQVQFTKVISGIPTFLPIGKPKDMGDSSKTIDYQMGLDK
jgi:hypothetical protein